MKLIDLTGQKFDRLTVIERSNKKRNRKTYWICKCDCGNFAVVSSDKLKSGHTKSCGCLHKEKSSILGKRTGGKNQIKHNLSHTRIHTIWLNMKDRCYNKKTPSYKNYGGRGIKVCSEWQKDFMNFYNWSINNGYADNLSIDRINNDGNYEPLNCRWATQKEQAQNTRNCVNITYKGETHCLSEWGRILKINRKKVREIINGTN